MLITANDGQLPFSMYIEVDVNFLGLKVMDVGFLIITECNCILDDQKADQNAWSSWNLIRLTFNVFVEKHGLSVFDLFSGHWM